VNVRRYLTHSRVENVVAVQRDEDSNYLGLGALSATIYDVPVRSLGLGSLLRICRIVRREKINIIHSHGKAAGLYGRVAAFLLGRRSVHSYRGYHARWSGLAGRLYRALEWTLSRITDQTIAVSPSERDKLVADRILPPERIVVLLNPIALADPGAEPAPLMPGRHNLVSIARLSPQKDIMTLVDVAAFLGDDYVIHLFGGTNSSDEDYAVRVRAHAQETGVGNIVFHGDVPNAGGLIRRYELYLTTARWEGLPTAVLEAFLSRVPVVGTRCTGNVDVIVPGKTGIVREPGDATELAAAVRALIADPAERHRLVEGAASFAAHELDVVRLVARQDEIYRDVLAQDPP